MAGIKKIYNGMHNVSTKGTVPKKEIYREVEGDLVEMAQEGKFEVIVQGCNCFCVQGSGLAPQMVEAFGTDKFDGEHEDLRGDIQKLGCIDYEQKTVADNQPIIVVNAYTQYKYGKNHADGDENPVDYEAITLCMRKINHEFAGMRVALPRIGAGLAGGSWPIIKNIIQKELRSVDTTVVIFNK